MTQDWSVDESHEEANRMFEEKGFPMPQKGWIFNSNWMDWNLTKGALRASVPWGLGPVKWTIFEGKDKEVATGKADIFQRAVLDGEKKLMEMIDEQVHIDPGSGTQKVDQPVPETDENKGAHD